MSAQRLSIASMFCTMANDTFADLMTGQPFQNLHASIEECTLGQVLQRVSIPAGAGAEKLIAAAAAINNA